MTKRAYGIYFLAAILTAFSYITMYHYIIELPHTWIVVSNLTLNYVLVAFGSGGVAGWYLWSKLLRKSHYLLRVICTSLGSGIISIIWLVVMTTFGGYHMRW